jgi:hypothetical protein
MSDDTGPGGTAQLTPTQQRVLAALRVGEPVVFPADEVAELRATATEAMEDLSVQLAGESLAVFKGFVARVHGCEVLHLQPDDFRWNAANAAGFVAHKAIELSLNWRGEPTPADVVDEAIARLADQNTSRGNFVAGLSDGEYADLRARAVDRTTKFLQQFPPLPRSAHPILESSVRWEAGTVELVGKADLVVGKPMASESRRLIVDFKSGGTSPLHLHDLRFYALLETLSQRVPPRKLVTYYLDYADLEVEDVTIDLLHAALRRTVDAVERHLALTRGGAAPVKKESHACRWCPVLPQCEEGTAFLGRHDRE